MSAKGYIDTILISIELTAHEVLRTIRQRVIPGIYHLVNIDVPRREVWAFSEAHSICGNLLKSRKLVAHKRKIDIMA